jgi:superfamily II DNA or RNA helicase
MLHLRQYQIDSIEGLRQAFRGGHSHIVLAAATGAGKSVIAMTMLESAVKKGARVMFVCDRRVLVDQFSRHLDGSGVEHGICMAGHWRHRPHANVQVASIQTLERMKGWPDVDLILVDEIHAVMRKSLKTFLSNHKDLRVIGMTATPFHAEMGKYFTNVTNVVTMRQLVDEGFLVPFRVFVAKEIDMSGVKVVAGEWQKDEAEKRGLQIVGDVVSDYIRISQDVFGGPRKTICFSSGVAHGEQLVQRFQEHGINAVQISYKDTDDFKEGVLKDFSQPDTEIKIVISSDILTRGFDQTDVEHVIIARPLRKAFSMHVQMVGRGARPHPGKKFCILQDHSGNWLRFADDWAQVYEEGTKELNSENDTKTRKEKTDEQKEQCKCPKCSALWPIGSDTCTNCGHTRQRRSMVAEMPGIMEELSGAAKRDEKQAFWSMCQYKIKMEGWSPGRGAHTYKEKFGVFPRGLVDSASSPDIGFEKFVKSRLIAYLKGKRQGLSS